MPQVALTRTVSFAYDFAVARAYAGVSASAATVLDLHKNGSPKHLYRSGTSSTGDPTLFPARPAPWLRRCIVQHIAWTKNEDDGDGSGSRAY